MTARIKRSLSVLEVSEIEGESINSVHRPRAKEHRKKHCTSKIADNEG